MPCCWHFLEAKVQQPRIMSGDWEGIDAEFEDLAKVSGQENLSAKGTTSNPQKLGLHKEFVLRSYRSDLLTYIFFNISLQRITSLEHIQLAYLFASDPSVRNSIKMEKAMYTLRYHPISFYVTKRRGIRR
jgi:hypothetical protein